MLTDDEIARLTPLERAELIERLARPIGELGTRAAQMRRAQRLRLLVLVFSTALLVPWIAYLAMTLPHHYEARHWRAAWVGFDVLLTALLGLTVVLAYQRRMLVVLSAFPAAVLLVTDAWFDVLTADPSDRLWSILSAVFAEIPLALVLFNGSLTLLKLTAARFYRIEPTARVWSVTSLLPARRRVEP